jgi:hypothetical protein
MTSQRNVESNVLNTGKPTDSASIVVGHSVFSPFDCVPGSLGDGLEAAVGRDGIF